MKPHLTLLILFTAAVLLSACQSDFIVSVRPQIQSTPISTEIHTTLNGILVSNGLQSQEIPSGSSGCIGFWRGIVGKQTFWHGQAQLDVRECISADKTIITIAQYGGVSGLDRELATRINEKLATRLPHCTITVATFREGLAN
jgi:hypothetical protein